MSASRSKKNKKVPCNWAVHREAAVETGEARSTVRHIADFVLGFVADNIKGETFETIQLPGFGKFRPRFGYISAREGKKGRSDLDKQRLRP